MKKVGIIIKREYNTRVKKKSFIILTILMPVLFAAVTILPTYLATMNDTEERTVAVYDGSGVFLGRLESSQYTKFHFIPKEDYDKLRDNLKESSYYAVLAIPPNVVNTNTVQLFSEKNIPFDLKNQIDQKLSDIIEKDKRSALLKEVAVPDLEQKLEAARTNIHVNTIRVGDKGEEHKSSTEIAMIMGYIFGFMIYIFIFIYGTMVMRGVMEEKQNRIVEVIISSVKPFELMMGKIVGIALVGLTQFVIWVVLFIGIFQVAKGFIPDISPEQAQNLMAQSQMSGQMESVAQSSQIQEIFSMMSSINFPLIIGSFFFFFIGGYLLYSSLFGAVGSAIDAEEDAQQFTLPVTIPLIVAIIVMMNAITNPEGPIAFWFSLIPFTSPVVMMVRIPFGVPAWELILSMALLVATFIGTVWVAGKIYRTGILMYGKKPTWKELGKWLTYRS